MRPASLILFVAATLAFLPGLPAVAEENEFEVRAGTFADLLAGPESPAFVPPPAILGERDALGSGGPSITVFYTGFSPEAQKAFQYAVDIWKSVIVTPVVVEIDAYWQPLGATTLGSAAPYDELRSFTGAPTANWYPVALANKLAGKDLREAYPDIVANFNSAQKNWYFGLDGRPPAGKYDFVTVVLHEIGHGLGMVGTMKLQGTGQWGTSFSDNSPAIYDAWVVNGAGKGLVSSFKNRTADLGKELVSNSLFWNGPGGIAGGDGKKPKLYAPKTWEQGSSVFHLDEATYPAGNANSLMTPVAGSAEAIHNPGPIVLGMLADMGWTTNSTEPAGLAFVSQMGVGVPGEILAIQPSVAIQNSAGVTIVTDNQTMVTIELSNGPPGAQIDCDGGLSARVAKGVATFRSCRINMQGATYQLTATAGQLAPAQSPQFGVIVRGPHRVGFAAVGRDAP